MDESERVTEHWYIVFKGSDLKHWIFKYLQPNFKHCYAVKESAGGQFWIIVDSKSCHTDVRIESKDHYPHIRLLAPDSVILSIRAIIHPENYRHTLGITACVDTCKAVLGIRDFWIWTPYQLYKRLISWQTR